MFDWLLQKRPQSALKCYKLSLKPSSHASPHWVSLYSHPPQVDRNFSFENKETEKWDVAAWLVSLWPNQTSSHRSFESGKQSRHPVLVTYRWRLRRTRSHFQASSIMQGGQLHTCFKVLFKPHIRSYLPWLRASLSFFSEGDRLSHETWLTFSCMLWGIL